MSSSSSVSHAISTPHTPPPHVRLLNDAEFAQVGGGLSQKIVLDTGEGWILPEGNGLLCSFPSEGTPRCGSLRASCITQHRAHRQAPSPLAASLTMPAMASNFKLIRTPLLSWSSQCLLNVDYVMWLASEGYFEDEAFLNYLKYLEYLRGAPYFHLLVYPSSMDMIRILRCPSVRQQLLKEPAAARAVLQEQLWCSWGLRKEEELKEGDEQVDEEMLKSEIIDSER